MQGIRKTARGIEQAPASGHSLSRASLAHEPRPLQELKPAGANAQLVLWDTLYSMCRAQPSSHPREIAFHVSLK